MSEKKEGRRKAHSLLGLIFGAILTIGCYVVITPMQRNLGLTLTGVALFVTAVNGVNLFSAQGMAKHRFEEKEKEKE